MRKVEGKMFGLKIKKFFQLCIFLLVSALLLFSGCSPSQEGKSGENQRRDHKEQSGIFIEDDLGRQVQLLEAPKRIISLAPGLTEILFALGLSERIVGVTEYCNYPPEALEKPKAGSFSEPSIEQIVALQPDLVVAVRLQSEMLSRLEELSVPLLVLEPTSVKDVYGAIEILGTAAGAEEKAYLLVSEIKERLEKTASRFSHLSESQRVRVYYEVYADPLMTAGSNSVIHELLEAAGGKNIFADIKEPYPMISSEAVIHRDPQVIVFPNYHGTEGFLANEIKNRPGWGGISALAEERIYGIDPDIISRPGPRIADAVELLASFFYPEQ